MNNQMTQKDTGRYFCMLNPTVTVKELGIATGSLYAHTNIIQPLIKEGIILPEKTWIKTKDGKRFAQWQTVKH